MSRAASLVSPNQVYRPALSSPPKVLREDIIPDVKPFLLLGGEQLPWRLERAGEDIAEPRAERLDDQHCLPVRDAEAGAVAV